MVDNRDEEIEINRIRARLASLEAERAELEASLAEIERRKAGAQAISACAILAANTPTVTTASPTADKVALFRRLFAGRSDVFPLRWENAKTGKAGYAPACANEWIRGVCGKPQVKCGECSHQAFIPVTDEIIDKHLRGGDGPRAFVAGVYPMLSDETCWFLAADFDKESWAADATAMIETCKAKGVPDIAQEGRRLRIDVQFFLMIAKRRHPHPLKAGAIRQRRRQLVGTGLGVDRVEDERHLPRKKRKAGISGIGNRQPGCNIFADLVGSGRLEVIVVIALFGQRRPVQTDIITTQSPFGNSDAAGLNEPADAGLACALAGMAS